jgi:hypothetical protein
MRSEPEFHAEFTETTESESLIATKKDMKKECDGSRRKDRIDSRERLR